MISSSKLIPVMITILIVFMTLQGKSVYPPSSSDFESLNVHYHEDTESLKTTPYAFYHENHVYVASPKEEMKPEDKLMTMRENSRHFMPLIIAHELIPGHHLEQFVYRRNEFKTCYDRGSIFYVEGWAFYWETLLWDLGYFKTPEDRLGALFWRMLRCARVITTFKYHQGSMQPQEMVDFLMSRIGNERLGAVSEVRRYVGNYPLYQACYLVGGLQLRELHREMVDSKKMSDQEFHDTVLSYSELPIEFVRAGIQKIPLDPKSPASWKFYPTLR